MKTMKLNAKRKPGWEMTRAELRRATWQYDRPMPLPSQAGTEKCFSVPA
jgi:hypothetical protein